MIKRLIWTIWTPMSSVLKKADKLNLSLSLSLTFTLATSIQVPIFTPHHNPGHVSPQSRSWYFLYVVPLQRIQVSRWLSQLNPCPISPSAKSQDLHLTPSQAPRFISPLHPGPENCIWAVFRSPQTLKPKSQNVDVKCFQVLSHLHPGPKILVSPTSMYRLTSIQVPRFHQGPNIRASPPSRSCLTSIQGTSRLIQISIIASQPHHNPISPYPGLKMCIPAQSRSDLTHIHVSRICASPPYRHLDSRLQSINSMHHLNPGLFIFNWPPFIYCLISILAHVFASHLHLWHDVNASRLLVAYHYHPCRESCISPSS